MPKPQYGKDRHKSLHLTQRDELAGGVVKLVEVRALLTRLVDDPPINGRDMLQRQHELLRALGRVDAAMTEALRLNLEMATDIDW